MNDLAILMLGAAVPVGIFILVWAVLVEGRQRQNLLVSRLAQLDVKSTHDSFESQELDEPLSERLIRPLLERVGSAMAKRTARAQMAALETSLALAGNPGKLTPGAFMAVQILGIGVLGASGLLLGLVLGSDVSIVLLLGVIGAIGGFMAPRIWLQRRVAARKEEILDGMPSALDLLCISVEAGLGFDAALMKVAEKFRNALADEFNQVIAEMRLGRSRREALKALAERVNIDELSTFVQAVVQSEQMGSSLGTTLRIQSEEMRRRRRQRAEEQGAKAPLKMLLPMVGCIFPTLFIVLLGPAALEIIHQFGGQ